MCVWKGGRQSMKKRRKTEDEEEEVDMKGD